MIFVKQINTPAVLWTTGSKRTEFVGDGNNWPVVTLDAKYRPR